MLEGPLAPAPQFSLQGEEPPPPPSLLLPFSSSSPLHIWLPPECSFGGKTRMFLFPRREEELQSETTELKHREASWALTQPSAAAAAEAAMARSSSALRHNLSTIFLSSIFSFYFPTYSVIFVPFNSLQNITNTQD